MSSAAACREASSETSLTPRSVRSLRSRSHTSCGWSTELHEGANAISPAPAAALPSVLANSRRVVKTLGRAASGAGLIAFAPSCSAVLQPHDVWDLLRSDRTDLGGRLVFDEASRQAAAD